MLAAVKVVTPPTMPVVDTATLAQHLRLDGDADPLVLPIYLNAATALVEKHLARALITQTLRWTVSEVGRQGGAPGWSSSLSPYSLLPLSLDGVARNLGKRTIDLPYGPVQSVAAVAVGYWDKADDTLSLGADYTLDLATDPARLRLEPQWTWGTYHHLSVDYVAGYGGMGSIPAPITAAVLLTAAALYEHRGDDGQSPGLSATTKALLAPYRVAWFA